MESQNSSPIITRRGLIKAAGGLAIVSAGAIITNSLLTREANAAYADKTLIEESMDWYEYGVMHHTIDGKTCYCMHAALPSGTGYVSSDRSVISVDWVGTLQHPVALGYVVKHGWTDDNRNTTYNGTGFTTNESIAITQRAVWKLTSGSEPFVDYLENAANWLMTQGLDYERTHPFSQDEPMLSGLVKWIGTNLEESSDKPPQEMIGPGTPKFGSITIKKSIQNYSDRLADQGFTIKVKVMDKYMPPYPGANECNSLLVGSYGGNIYDSSGTTTFTLKHNETKTLDSLPTGCAFYVSEVDLGQTYELVSISPSEGTVGHNTNTEITVTNKYLPGHLKMEKQFDI